MNYLVIELQTTNGKTAHIATAYDNQPQAESKFHQILSSASVSNVQTHAAALLDEFGNRIDGKYYRHGTTEEQSNE